MDFSSIMGLLYSWIVNPLIWLLIIGFFFLATIGALMVRRKRKLVYPAAEIVDLGDGKTGINLLRAGWFGKTTYLFGLWDVGEQVMKIKNGDIIHKFSTEDFQEVNGERGVIFFRHPQQQKILIPITNLEIKNGQVIAELPRIDIVNAAIDIINDTTKETSDWKNKILEMLVIGGIIVFALVAIIVIAQMVKNGQDKAADLIVKAGQVCTDNCKTICSDIANTYIKSKAP